MSKSETSIKDPKLLRSCTTSCNKLLALSQETSVLQAEHRVVGESQAAMVGELGAEEPNPSATRIFEDLIRMLPQQAREADQATEVAAAAPTLKKPRDPCGEDGDLF